MIGKPITGKSFGGCVRYLVNRPEAMILEAEGIRVASAHTITTDFNLQRKLNPQLGKAVGHTILSWSTMDKGKLSDEIMLRVAHEYMEKMGIKDTQFLIVKHMDRQHPHLHLVYNRVDNKGKTISDQNNYRRNVSVCRELTQVYQFHFGKDKRQVNRQRLKGTDKIKYELYDAIKIALYTARNWQHLELLLKKKNIDLRFTFKGKSGQVQGVSFSKDGLVMKGSAIDRSFSFAKLDHILGNEIKPVARKGIEEHPVPDTASNDEMMEPMMTDNPETDIHTLPSGVETVIDILFSDEHTYEVYDPFERERRRRKRKKIDRGISR